MKKSEKLEVVTWYEIITAPKDGTSILGYSPFGGLMEGKGGYCQVIKWNPNAFPESVPSGGWQSGEDDEDSRSTYCGMTHWMPLPAPPKINLLSCKTPKLISSN